MSSSPGPESLLPNLVKRDFVDIIILVIMRPGGCPGSCESKPVTFTKGRQQVKGKSQVTQVSDPENEDTLQKWDKQGHKQPL